MSTSVPEGMSSVNAFDALYKKARVMGLGKRNSSAGVCATSPWNAIQIYQTYCQDGFCDYVRGKYMKVDFRSFPLLNTTIYDKQYGKGAAQKALDEYQNRVDRLDRKDEYNLNCKFCEYFTPSWKEKTPFESREDLNRVFQKCEQFREAEKKIDDQIKKIQPNAILNHCKASYTIRFRGGYIGHTYRSCHEALKHFKMLSESDLYEAINIDKLSICKYNCYFPLFKQCHNQTENVSLAGAIRLLECLTPRSK